MLNSSNLKMAVKKGLQLAYNISTSLTSVDFDSKQKLQTLVFPDGITYSMKTGTVQTQRVSSLFTQIKPWKQALSE